MQQKNFALFPAFSSRGDAQVNMEPCVHFRCPLEPSPQAHGETSRVRLKEPRWGHRFEPRRLLHPLLSTEGPSLTLPSGWEYKADSLLALSFLKLPQEASDR